MSLNVSEKIQRATNSMQKKLHDNWITLTGANVNTFLIDMEQDKYQNRSYVLKDYKPISIRVEFPGQEIPVSTMGTNNNQTASNVLHLYDILPIVAYVRFSDEVKTGNLIFYKVKLGNGEFQTLILQFLQPIAQANRVGIVYQEWVIAPCVDNRLLANPALQSLLKEYKETDNW